MNILSSITILCTHGKNADYFKGLGTQKRFRLPVKLEMRYVFFKRIPVKDNETSKTRLACTKLFCLRQVEHLRRASKPLSRS